MLRFVHLQRLLNSKTMKKVKILIAVVLTALCVSSCSILSNMTYDEAYDVGYRIGSVASYLLDEDNY